MSHLSPSQVDLLDEFDRGEYSDEDFTALALEAGLSHGRIQRAITGRRDTEASAAETMREVAAECHFGIAA